MLSMAASKAAMVAKVILSEEAEIVPSVVKTATRMMRTAATEESGICMESVSRVEVESFSKLESPLQPNIKEIDIGRTPAEVEFPGSKGAPEINPGGRRKELDIDNSPREVDFPNSKINPELKPGEIDITEQISKNVPSNPTPFTQNPAADQGKHKPGMPEVGEARTTVEVDRRRDQQESTDDGFKQLEVEKEQGGPEVQQNPRDGLIN